MLLPNDTPAPDGEVQIASPCYMRAPAASIPELCRCRFFSHSKLYYIPFIWTSRNVHDLHFLNTAVSSSGSRSGWRQHWSPRVTQWMDGGFSHLVAVSQKLLKACRRSWSMERILTNGYFHVSILPPMFSQSSQSVNNLERTRQLNCAYGMYVWWRSGECT